MPALPWHYLDFAATSAVRPRGVADAVYEYLTQIGATPGRSGHRLSTRAGRVALRCRRAVLRILGLGEDPTRVAFTLNATQALNIALHGLLGAGDVVVITNLDHNSVLRPVHRLVVDHGVEARMIRVDRTGVPDMGDAEASLDGARLLVVNAASNVLGTCLPLERLARLAHGAGALVLVDSAQWAGHFEAGLARLGADIVAFTGHKGLLGPQGIGGIWARPGLDLVPVYQGGTGSESESREMPRVLPDRLEAGSANGPAMAGLDAGIEFLEREGVRRLHEREMRLKARLWAGLEALPGVELLSPPAEEGVAIVTIRSRRLSCPDLSKKLDEEWGVLTRHGLNCAPEVHRMLGTLRSGAVRFSLGWSSTPEDVDQAIRGVDVITSAPSVPVS
jgi:cysteine desulfurase/selenocysteine lyase